MTLPVGTWDELAELIQGSRDIHERLLRASEIEETAGTCLYASFVLRMALEKFGRCRATIRGGDGGDDGGAVDVHGTLRGHYWVEGTTPEGIAFVADVTADQFGHPPVYFERADASRTRYIPGDDTVVSEAVADLAQSIADTAQH